MESVVAWVLVAVLVDDGKVGISVNRNYFATMDNCFKYREETIRQLDAWPVPNLQFICVPADAKGLGAELI